MNITHQDCARVGTHLPLRHRITRQMKNAIARHVRNADINQLLEADIVWTVQDDAELRKYLETRREKMARRIERDQ